MATRQTSTSGSPVSVAASATSINLLAANTQRLGASIFNDSTATLYVKMGTTASTTSHTVQLVGGAFYELPEPMYLGIVTGIWASATGSARISEMI
ncbi:hypothetical protein H0W80_00010 [Candidatus Saccharibacteria bacterium]|nr:hypothetical protein [Candidatus Saccharibacteria bacterium]